MRRIVSVTPLPRQRLALQWASGETAEVDLASVFSKGVFAALKGPRAFARVEIGERGRSIFWRDAEGDELDLCADALWEIAFERPAEAAE